MINYLKFILIMIENAIKIINLEKHYANGIHALKKINLKIKRGEIFALLGPNGAGKSTLINIICGIANKSSGHVSIFGYDNIKDYKTARSLIGLVPQEIATDSFERVVNTIHFSRGLFNKPRSEKIVGMVLKDLALEKKKNSQIRTLSGGMKRRLMIAKALSHEPKIIFLDEPTAGVDVNLRKTLWKNILKLKRKGITIFLTTHYIEEAENIADRIGIIDDGEIKTIESKDQIIKKFSEKKIKFVISKEYIRNHNYCKKMKSILKKHNGIKENNKLVFQLNSNDKDNEYSLISDLLKKSIVFEKIETENSNLEKIFLKIIDK